MTHHDDFAKEVTKSKLPRGSRTLRWQRRDKPFWASGVGTTPAAPWSLRSRGAGGPYGTKPGSHKPGAGPSAAPCTLCSWFKKHNRCLLSYSSLFLYFPFHLWKHMIWIYNITWNYIIYVIIICLPPSKMISVMSGSVLDPIPCCLRYIRGAQVHWSNLSLFGSKVQIYRGNSALLPCGG